MSTSKRHLQEWKRSSQIVALTSSYSENYRISSVFRETISRMIINPFEQLELKFISYHSSVPIDCMGIVKKLEIHNGTLENYPLQLDELVLVDSSFRKLEGFPLQDCPPIRKLRFDRSSSDSIILDVANDIRLPLLQSLKEVSFNYVMIENYSQAFSHLESLSIWNSPSLQDVSCFKTIRRLKFRNCQGIADVACLGNVMELQLSYCQGIQDVSALGKVYHLDLSYCNNIEDVSALGNVHILNLNHCYLVADVSALKNVYELHLECFKGDELLGLENLVKLFLSKSHKVTDLSPLRNVNELHIVNCTQISDFQPLQEYGRLAEMSIGRDDGISCTKFRITSGKPVFERLKKLELHHVRLTERLSTFHLSWNSLANIRELIFRECELTTIPVESFHHLQTLKLYLCEDITHLPELPPSLGTLVIEQCSALIQLHLRSSSTSLVEFPLYLVEILDCPNLKRLEVSRKISRFHLWNCEKLENLVITNQIGFLQLDDCPVLAIPTESRAQLVCCDILE
jgi:hypothetical protein